MSKFTPGPWGAIISGGESASGYPRGGLVIGPSQVARDKSWAYTEEDARLISAAPDMHKVCDGLEKWWRLPNAERTIENIEQVVRDALEALAKADGK